MIFQQRFRQIAPLLIAIIAIIVLAASLSSLRLEPGDPFPWGAFLQDAGTQNRAIVPTAFSGETRLPMIFVILFWVCVPLSILYAIVSPTMRRQLLRTLPIIIIIMLLLLVFREAQQNQRERELPFREGGLPQAAEIAELEPPEYVTDPPAWIFTAFNLILLLLFCGITWFLWRRLQRLRRSPETDAHVRIVEEAERALYDLYQGGDLKSTIMHCYQQMGQVFQEEQNIRRRHTMTAREFEQYLAGLGLRDEHIRRLTRLFESVRYGHEKPGKREELEAVDCLKAIVSAYGSEV